MIPDGATIRSGRHVRSSLRTLWGPQALAHLGPELERLGVQRALLVCGSTLGADTTTMSAVARGSGARISRVFAGVREHSPLGSVEQAVRQGTAARVDGIVALGGGSALVTARAIAILLAERGPVSELATSRGGDEGFHSPRLERPKLPVIALPTTPTTAVAKAGTAVTADGADRRYALFDPKTRARSIIVDESLMATAPAPLMHTATLNGIAMCVEGLVAKGSNVFSDAALTQALGVYRANLFAGAEGDAAARVQLALAGVLCGEGTDTSGVGLTAALSHELGHRFGIANGVLDAVLLPHVLAELREQGVAVPDTRAVTGTLTASLRALGMPDDLRSLGVPGEALSSIADAAVLDFAVRSSPVTVAPELAERVLRAAWETGGPAR